jgi:hypothetical protein
VSSVLLQGFSRWWHCIAAPLIAQRSDPIFASAGALSVSFASSLGGMLLTTPTMPLSEMIMKFFNGFPYLEISHVLSLFDLM